MKVTRNTSLEKEVIDKLKRSGSVRKGFHVTDLVGCPRRTYFRMKGTYEAGEEGRELLYARGRAHHDILEVSEFREIPVSRDGLSGVIDMLGERIIEIYTTVMSSERKPIDFSLKVKQLKAYCWMYGRTDGDLLIFHLFGDYKDRTPQLRCWTLEFTKEEIDDNWKEMMSRRELIKKCLENDKVPDMRCEEWECKNCGYHYICRVEKLSPEELEKLNKLYEVI